MRTFAYSAIAGAVLLASGAAHAATTRVTDATLDATLDVAVSSGFLKGLRTLSVDGTVTGKVIGDPNIERDYDLTVRADIDGVTAFDAVIDISGILSVLYGDEFAINSVANSVDLLATPFGLGFVAGILRLDQGNSLLVDVNTDVASFSPVYAPACKLLGFGDCSADGTATVDLSLALVYDAIAPVPLPASLPLLLAGIGGIAALRRRART